jgi:hypothetical protein
MEWDAAPVRGGKPATPNTRGSFAGEPACFFGQRPDRLRVTSSWSPILKKFIALAHLQKPYFKKEHR